MSGNDPVKLSELNGCCCDRCGRLITAMEEGWVEWLASENGNEEEVLSWLQLVHRGSIQPNRRRQACRYESLKEFRNGKAIAEGLPLERFVGPHIVESSTQQVARESTDHPSATWNFKGFILLQNFRTLWTLGRQAQGFASALDGV